MTTTDAVNTEIVNQVYRECLDARYERDYYQELYDRTIRYSRVYDYSIGLGSAGSGGTGLGILADPKFAFVCGTVTTISVLLSIAKGIWDWPGKTKFALDRVQFYDGLAAGYEDLVDDLNAAKEWKPEFASRRAELRKNSRPGSPDPYPKLSEGVRRRIQNAIKQQVSYSTWWLWRPST
jgi:hypothetical protein